MQYSKKIQLTGLKWERGYVSEIPGMMQLRLTYRQGVFEEETRIDGDDLNFTPACSSFLCQAFDKFNMLPLFVPFGVVEARKVADAMVTEYQGYE